MMRKDRKSRGDTIVEVLIALTVLITILVGAYVTANRSQNTNRASQERSEAIKVAESQLEGLKGLLVSNKLPAGTVFCVLADNSGYKDLTTNPFTQALEAPGAVPYQPADCANRSARYNVAIRKTGDTYEVLVRWDRIGGRRDQVNMFYRTYP